ncbi:hypothetical protein AcV5_007284 [Taiwanofungus camphoratus]|nr:hypothetical protein AcV5_007284 [Antrodia cinnamomea]
MPVTRSASGASARKTSTAVSATVAVELASVTQKTKSTKRKAPAATISKTPRKKARSKEGSGALSEPGPVVLANASTALPLLVPGEDEQVQLVPAVLSFSFKEAKKHLANADVRFEGVFKRLKCKPFEHLEMVDPFRTLCHSIMGQQISWRAARSIIHRFLRLFNPSLPEKAEEYSQYEGRESFFPTARQVVNMDITTLKSAGLSGRKAEYVLDLASRFADGRLSTEKLLQAKDEELYDMLTEVRGIGRWTVDMFALFSLRRPDILPVGDLGVQRGVLRWFLSLHSSSYQITISPHKLPKNPEEEDGKEPIANGQNGKGADAEVLPVLGEPSASKEARSLSPDVSSIPPAPALPKTPAPKGKGKGRSKVSDEDEEDGGGATVLPMPFTPSINKTLYMIVNQNGAPPPLPEGLSPAILKGRLEGKKKIKGALLTPKEMEDLTASWRPYRSLGVYYMWALAEPSK